MTSITWTRSAISDVKNLRDFIAQDSEAYADRFVQKILEVVERIGNFPNLGRKMPEALDESIREVLFRNYRIIYRREERNVLVLMVVHAARDFSRLAPKPWEIT